MLHLNPANFKIILENHKIGLAIKALGFWLNSKKFLVLSSRPVPVMGSPVSISGRGKMNTFFLAAGHELFF
ncbi:hypothetical protein GCM10023115_40130 [Pontixanthobacter gangjinensis]